MGDAMTLVMLANGDDPTKVTDKSFNTALQPDQEGGRQQADPPVHRQRLRAVAREGRPRRGHVLVGRHRADRQQAHPLERARRPAATLWTDNMLIPKGGNVYTASVYMNYVYDPKVQGLMEAGDPKRNITGIYYIPPVNGAEASARRSTTPPVANNPLIFPTAKMLDSVHIFDRKALNNQKYLTQWQNLISALRSSLSFFHRHRGLTPYLLLAPGLAVPGGVLRRAARVPRLPVAAVGQHRLRLLVHVGVEQLLGRDLATTTPQFIRSLEYAAIATRARARAQLPGRVLDRVPRRALEEPAACCSSSRRSSSRT